VDTTEDAENLLNGDGICQGNLEHTENDLAHEFRWLSHVLNLRHENFLHDIMEGKMIGKATWHREKDGVMARYNGRERL